MATQIKAKMRVWTNTPANLDKEGVKHGETVTLSAVHSNDPNSENYTYSQATPAANLNMYISNPGAFDVFQPGDEYVLTFDKVEKAS